MLTWHTLTLALMVCQPAVSQTKSTQKDLLSLCSEKSSVCSFSQLSYFINLVLEDFAAAHPNWKSINSVEFGLKEILARWQDPKSADSIMKVQNELDETKQIVSETLEKILDRGQKLDDLVRYLFLRINRSKLDSSRSNELSEQSKAFYKTAKKTNSWCCSIM